MHPSLTLLVISPVAGLVTALLVGFGASGGGGADRVLPVLPSSLQAAVEDGDVDAAVWLLEQGVAVEGTDAEGGTLLMTALRNRDPAMARTLLAWGANPRAVDAAGGSVLYHAIRAGEVSIVKELLDRGAPARGPTPEGGTLLAYAVAEGRTASAALLLDSGASAKGRTDAGRPVAFHAAERQKDWLLRDLLQRGADVDARDDRGETLVHAAVRQGDVSVLPLIWSYGADANVTNKAGEAPLHLAIATGASRLVVNLHSRGAALALPDPEEGVPVAMALRRDNPAVLRQLLELGARGDITMPDGRSAVAIALERRDFESARLLVEHGAKLDGLLEGAVHSGDTELFDFLIRNGASPDAEGTALVLTIRLDRPEMALALLQAGAPVPTGKVCAGQGLFHLAMARGQVEVVQALLERGADLNEAFAEPVSEEFLELVKSEGGIKWFLKKDRRVTPLMMAADRGDLAMLRLLLKHGADTDTSTRRHGMWPVNFASRRSDVKAMQVMFGVDPNHEERWVKVDLSEQKAWVFGRNDEVLLETVVSTGKPGYRTRTGSYVISNKYRHWTSTLYGASMPYFQRLSCGDFGFHQGYCPGYAASHGCLRVPSGKASKFYKLTKVGDRVEIVE